MSEFHMVKDERLREALQTIGIALGIIGVVVAVLSFVT